MTDREIRINQDNEARNWIERRKREEAERARIRERDMRTVETLKKAATLVLILGAIYAAFCALNGAL